LKKKKNGLIKPKRWDKRTVEKRGKHIFRPFINDFFDQINDISGFTKILPDFWAIF
jgi:hypothetical protein